MLTILILGIFKPKVLLANYITLDTPIDPQTATEALSKPEWKNAMNFEFEALLKNNTWELVPHTPDMNVITTIWVFRKKFRYDGSLDKHKVCLVARGF